ncbi:MAG TPA: hypothetical protein VN867_10075 [Candidatus Binataceae bacterium]|nr:hypothetical protein [Candidatus Binataceae bacterium]
MGRTLRIVRRPICYAISCAALLVLIFIGCDRTFTAGDTNLLPNGSLSAGAGDVPESWALTAHTPPDAFKWSHQSGNPPQLEIAAIKGSHRRSYWTQRVNLVAGWYLLRAEVKTDSPDSAAVLKVNDVKAVGRAVQSAVAWMPLSFYFKVGSPSESVEIGCGVRAEVSGKAFFRDIRLIKISGEPPFLAQQVDLTRVEPITATESAMLAEAMFAKAPAEVSLMREATSIPVIAVMLFVIAGLTYLDWRFGLSLPNAEASDDLRTPSSAEENARKSIIRKIPREIWKSLGIALSLCLILLMTWLVSRIEYLPGTGFMVVEPRAVRGDEPHYLIIINSLIFDHDVQLQNDYDRVDRGGLDAGVEARGIHLDRQTIVGNRRTGHRSSGYVVGGLWNRDSSPEFAPSPDVYEVPAHPIGFPVLIALIVAPFHPRLEDTEADVGLVLALIAWLGTVATYFLARQIDMGRGPAMLAALVLAAASPWLAYSRSYFPEATIGLAMVLAMWALMADLPIPASLGAAVAAVLKPGFAIIGACFFVEEIRERRWRQATKIALTLGVPAVALFAFNFWMHGRFVTARLAWSFDLHELYDTMLDPKHGLFVFAPWAIVAFAEAIRSLFSLSSQARFLRSIALPMTLYLLLLSSTGFGPGHCFGPRYWIAFMPWMAVGAVYAMRNRGCFVRAVFALLVVIGVTIAVPSALRYPQLFDKPMPAVWRGFN